jgi:hypothetical protein
MGAMAWAIKGERRARKNKNFSFISKPSIKRDSSVSLDSNQNR